MKSFSPETRGRLLDAAAALLAKVGFDAMRMEDVATRAVIGKPTIYRYFRTKDELLAAVVADCGQQFLGVLTVADARRVSPGERVAGVVAAAFDYLSARRHLLPLLDRPPGLWRDVEARAVRLLRGLLAEGVARGAFALPADCLDAAPSALLGAVRHRAFYPDGDTGREFVANLVAAVVRPVTDARAAA